MFDEVAVEFDSEVFEADNILSLQNLFDSIDDFFGCSFDKQDVWVGVASDGEERIL